MLLNAARIKMCNAFEHQAQRDRSTWSADLAKSCIGKVIPSRATIWAAAFECRTQCDAF